MKVAHAVVASAVAILVSTVAAAARPAEAPALRRVTRPAASEDGISVFFSPQGGVVDALAEQIGLARRTLDVQAYLLTTKDVAKPIADAHRRGVRVRVLLDVGQREDKYSAATYLRNAGVPVWTDGEHKVAHNKVMLIDGQVLITGSVN